MVYDCFPFFNELDLLELRLETMNEVADRFVLVEGTKTFSGKDKELIFDQNRSRYAKFLDRIIYVKVDDYPPLENSWTYENWQRNCIVRGLVGCKDDDTILISDCDEIPNPETVKKLIGKRGVYNLEQLVFVHYLDAFSANFPIWGFGTKQLSYHAFKHFFDHRFRVHYDDGCDREMNKGTTANKIRSYGHYWNVQRGGWHFSYMGGAAAEVAKIKAFSHQELNTPEHTDVEKTAKMIHDSIYGPNPTMKIAKLNEAMPKYLVEHPEKFAAMLIGGGSFEVDSAWPKLTWRNKLSQAWDVFRHII